jgi:hypothetical protein
MNRAATKIGRAWRLYNKRRKAVAVIEAAWKEYAYAPGGPMYAKGAARWAAMFLVAAPKNIIGPDR